MSEPLAPCPACRRHLRVTDPTCPFCGEPMPASFRRSVLRATATQRLSRSALAALGAAGLAGVALAGCGAKSGLEIPTEPAPIRAATDSGVVASRADAGRALAPDAAVVDPADSGSDGGADAGEPGLIAMYGGPPTPIEPLDAGSPDDAGYDAGDVVNLYGAPPPA